MPSKTPKDSKITKGESDKRRHHRPRKQARVIEDKVEGKVLNHLKRYRKFIANDPRHIKSIMTKAEAIAKSRSLSTDFHYRPHEIRLSRLGMLSNAKFLMTILRDIVNKAKTIPSAIVPHHSINLRKIYIGTTSGLRLSTPEIFRLEAAIKKACSQYKDYREDRKSAVKKVNKRMKGRGH